MSDPKETSVELEPSDNVPALGLDTDGGKAEKVDEGSSLELDITTGPLDDEGDEDAGEQAAKEEPEDTTAEEPNDGEEDKDEGEAPAELPPFKADDEEVIKAYKDAYAPNGELNIHRLSDEFWAGGDPKANIPGTLKEDTYAFLEKTYGLKKADVKDIEAGLVLKHQGETEKVLAVAGGAEGFNAALAWAKSGGYSKDQLARFEKLSNSKDLADRQEAVELLAERFKKANPAPERESRRQLKPERTVDPKAEQTPTRTKTGPKPFESKEAWMTELDKARNSNNPDDFRAVRARLLVSPWYQKQSRQQKAQR